MQKFWMVWRAGSMDVRVQHSTFESALMEAQRLAEKARIGAFVVLEAVSIVKAEVIVNVERPEPSPFFLLNGVESFIDATGRIIPDPHPEGR